MPGGFSYNPKDPASRDIQELRHKWFGSDDSRYIKPRAMTIDEYRLENTPEWMHGIFGMGGAGVSQGQELGFGGGPQLRPSGGVQIPGYSWKAAKEGRGQYSTEQLQEVQSIFGSGQGGAEPPTEAPPEEEGGGGQASEWDYPAWMINMAQWRNW